MKKSFQYTAAAAAAAFAVFPVNAANILGIDVSSAQGSINWTTVKNNGVEFAFVRATLGTNFEDPDFTTNMANGKSAGVQMGAYDYSQPYANTPAEEANYFWNYAGSYIKSDGKSISPAVSFTVFEGHLGANSYTTWFNDWGADVQAKLTATIHPAIYVTPCGGACDLTTNIALAGWVAEYNGENIYTGNPWSTCTNCEPWGPNGWTYWQASDTGAIGGISGPVDLDAYDGTLATLKSTEGVGGK